MASTLRCQQQGYIWAFSYSFLNFNFQGILGADSRILFHQKFSRVTSPKTSFYNLPSDMCDHQSVAIHWVPWAMPPPSTESPADVTCEEREGWTRFTWGKSDSTSSYWQLLLEKKVGIFDIYIYNLRTTTTDDTTATTTAAATTTTAGNCSLTNIAIFLEYYFGNLGNLLLS